MQGTIEAVNRSQSGKTLGVKVGEQWYTTKNWELEQKVGVAITFEPSSSEFNGKVMYWLNDYVEVGASTTPSAQAFDAALAQNQVPQAPQRPATAQTPQSSGKDRDASIVAQALTKACTAPGDDITVVWNRYFGFYSRYMAWDGKTGVDEGTPYSDEIPF